jgi:hypothetical protein
MLDGADLALDSADAEPAGDQHTMDVVEHSRRTAGCFAVVGGHPADLHFRPVFEPGCPQRFGD